MTSKYAKLDVMNNQISEPKVVNKELDKLGDSAYCFGLIHLTSLTEEFWSAGKRGILIITVIEK